VTVTWQSIAGVNYFLERSTNLAASPPFTLLAPNLLGQPGTTSFTDTNAAGSGRSFTALECTECLGSEGGSRRETETQNHRLKGKPWHLGPSFRPSGSSRARDPAWKIDIALEIKGA